MTTTPRDDGGPAFPSQITTEDRNGAPIVTEFKGLSAREYAAIHLRVPDSGTAWLDEMIYQQIRSQAFSEVACTMLTDMRLVAKEPAWFDHAAVIAIRIADAMVAASNPELVERLAKAKKGSN